MRTLFRTYNFISGIALTRNDANQCSHPGDCTQDVEAVSQKPYVQRQLKQIDPDQLRKELKEYGAWDEEQLSDHKENCLRIVWLAANDIVEELLYLKTH